MNCVVFSYPESTLTGRLEDRGFQIGKEREGGALEMV